MESSTTELVKAATAAASLVVTAATAVVAGVWAVHKWAAQRKSEAEATARQHEAGIQQDRLRLDMQRIDQAAGLIQALGKAQGDERVWAAMALALYPEQTLPLLAMALCRIDNQGAPGVENALAALGVRSLPEVAKMNRIAVTTQAVTTPGTASPAPQLARTGRVINQILLHAHEDELAAVDLDGVDLSGAVFRDAKLPQINLRKTNLSQVDFAGARLRQAKFRGANLNQSLFTRAKADGADFTGAIGPAGFIRLVANKAVFKNSHFSKCDFSGADLSEADLDHADFSQSTISGAVLSAARMEGTNLCRSIAHSCHFHRTRLSHAKLSGADLSRSSLQGAQMDNCQMTAAMLDHATIKETRIVNTNLGGASLAHAHVSNTIFDRCLLGGTDFTKAVMEDCIFQDCSFAATIFDKAILRSVRFTGECVVAGRPLSLTGTITENVDVSERSPSLRIVLAENAEPTTA
jgi:uncharacterized protein YjbI with pentapeptide repeats